QLVGPAGAGQPVTQVVQVAVWDLDAERPELGGHGCLLGRGRYRQPTNHCGRKRSSIGGRLGSHGHLRATGEAAEPAPGAARLDRPGAGRAARGHGPDGPQRRRAAASPRLSRPGQPRGGGGAPGGGGRTVRNAVERLRRLGYPVQASPGVGGGYRLGAGAALPPLLLDDEEAVAVAVGLRTAAGGAVAGIEETSLRALAKLEQVLPSRLRRRVGALHSAMTAVSGAGPAVDPGVLTAIATAVRDRERLRFDYRHHDGADSGLCVEAHRMVSWGRRWYLVAWDVGREDWRTFRVDRLRPRLPTGPRFTPRKVPGGDVAAYVEKTVGQATWRYRARVLLHAPATELAGRLPPAVGPGAGGGHA